MAEKGNPPVRKIRIPRHHVEAAVWANTVERDGEEVIRHSVKLTKSYKDPKM